MFDDDDGPGLSPFALFGPMMGVLVPVLMISILAPLILYVIARWRDARSPAPDPQLGLKFALGFFRLQGYLLLLYGGAMLLFSILMKGEGRAMSEVREMIYRPAFGLLVPGGLVFGATSAMLAKTNRIEYPQVGRLWAGYNLMIVGSIGFVALIMLFQIMFAKGESGQPGRIAWTGVLVFTSAAVVQAILFAKEVMEGPPPPTTWPPEAPPPPADVPPPMQKPLA